MKSKRNDKSCPTEVILPLWNPRMEHTQRREKNWGPGNTFEPLYADNLMLALILGHLSLLK